MVDATDKITLGISACLLGHKVRFDGGHKLDSWLVNTLGAYVRFVPVCPEVEMGLPVPREALRLVGDPQNPRLITVRGGEDFTGRMREWSQERIRGLHDEGLCGFIFKRASPSSGMERVKVYRDVPPEEAKKAGPPVNAGVGIFAAEFMRAFPLLPAEEEGRLNDPALRENFVERIFVMRRWRQLLQEGMTPGGLVAFHTRHKLLIMSHSVEHYRTMGKLVAGAGTHERAEELAERYQTLLLTAMGREATVKKHVNVLQHVMGYFKKTLTADEKQELLEIIQAYHAGLVPLIVPVTLLNHYVRKYAESYLAGQWYLSPHPLELKLRNHV
ncbi:YbgA family protein [Desulfovibrio psychrotolerans]|uniref:DUF1722 domain-containing protein n=1 Tax=Desulfovibrio psychrotolerans TaxID=415242 RepID=A0A7J0BVS3_9BACT|nr:DUF523 and DUF1722 domain-containing protein [Desulfovibrio psychrotolerans]GFM37778.1 hypothetical protein DSM19430T_24620 [Desulfovibrio psychrotolerans]